MKQFSIHLPLFSPTHIFFRYTCIMENGVCSGACLLNCFCYHPNLVSLLFAVLYSQNFLGLGPFHLFLNMNIISLFIAGQVCQNPQVFGSLKDLWADWWQQVQKCIESFFIYAENFWKTQKKSGAIIIMHFSLVPAFQPSHNLLPIAVLKTLLCTNFELQMTISSHSPE